MFGLTVNPANAQYLTADLGSDTTNVKLLVCPDYVAGNHYVMIDHKSAMKLANPKNPGKWIQELRKGLRQHNGASSLWSTTPEPGKGALVTAWKTEGAVNYLDLDNVIRAIEDRAPAAYKPNAGILRDLKREVLKNF